jgi:similar to stage IV sporulation protein
LLFKILLSYIEGYVNITVEGYYIERFINMCISKSIFLWNVRREKSTYVHCNIRIKDFRKIRLIAKKTNCKFIIKKKCGIPFLLNKYRKRKIFVILLACICGIIFTTSRFVWNIEIEGNEAIDTTELLNELNNYGLKLGEYKSKIDTEKIIRKIRLERDDIAWMSINIKGTNAIVKIVENTKKPEIISSDNYCSIVAEKAGVITKITAKTGTVLVKEGEVVNKGTVLVGRMDGRKIYRSKICT